MVVIGIRRYTYKRSVSPRARRQCAGRLETYSNQFSYAQTFHKGDELLISLSPDILTCFQSSVDQAQAIG